MELEDVEEDGACVAHGTTTSACQRKDEVGSFAWSSPSPEFSNGTATEEKTARLPTPEKLQPATPSNENQLEKDSFRQETFEMDRCPTVESEMESRLAHTPSPSPKPTDFYIWQPMKPGYSVRLESPGLQLFSRSAAGEATSASGQSESGLKQAIPVMPRVWSVVCCFLNIFVPGLGTMVGGLSVLCCSRPRFAYLSRSSVLWLNAWVALLQVLTTFLLLFGWIWSIIWGVNFVNLSNKYHRHESSQGNVNTSHRWHTGMPVAVGGGPTQVAITDVTASSVSSNLRTEAISSSAVGDSPIIVLHEAPVLVLQPSAIREETRSCVPCRTSRPSQAASRRNNGQRQDTVQLLQQGDYPEMLLTPGTLETIVIHNGAYFIQRQRPSLARPQTPSGPSWSSEASRQEKPVSGGLATTSGHQ